VIDSDCTGSCKFNCHTITAPQNAILSIAYISIRIVFVYILGNVYILESDIDIVRCLKSGLIIEVASLEEDNLLVFYYLSASEIWPDKVCGLCVKGLLEGDYCTHIKSYRK
jgi:hypothetical protein